jgi:hypothetical protein
MAGRFRQFMLGTAVISSGIWADFKMGHVFELMAEDKPKLVMVGMPKSADELDGSPACLERTSNLLVMRPRPEGKECPPGQQQITVHVNRLPLPQGQQTATHRSDKNSKGRDSFVER